MSDTLVGTNIGEVNNIVEQKYELLRKDFNTDIIALRDDLKTDIEAFKVSVAELKR